MPLPKKLNRKSLPKWTKTLSAGEIRHLDQDAGGLSLKILKRNLAKQKKGDCWACWFIGKKLGLVTD